MPALSMGWVNLQAGLGWAGLGLVANFMPFGGLGRWQVAKTNGFYYGRLCNRADHYIFILFLSFFFFFISSPNLRDWMSTILPHMVWP